MTVATAVCLWIHGEWLRWDSLPSNYTVKRRWNDIQKQLGWSVGWGVSGTGPGLWNPKEELFRIRGAQTYQCDISYQCNFCFFLPGHWLLGVMAGLRGSSIVLRSALELFSMFKILKVYSLWHWWSHSTFDITFTMNSWDDFKPFVFNHQFFSGCSKYLASHITGRGLCIFDKEFKFETDSFWYFCILLCSKIYIFKSETWGHETLVFAIIFSSISLNAFRTPLVKWHTPSSPCEGGLPYDIHTNK